MKALSVFSGGLDSMLASELIRALNIEVQALFFETPFFSAEKAIESARIINLPVKVIDITARHLEIVKKPKYGYGGNMNPCIDCHALMFRIAGEMLGGEGADFIITGEVLGQRPMSQNRRALSIVDRESEMEGFVLRPLSAKHFPSSIPEKRGWVDREKLMDLSGRSRKPQMALAKKFNIEQYPAPAGGCLLTDNIFSKRLKDLIKSGVSIERRDLELLKVGRHFRAGPKTKIIVGRNKNENLIIQALSGEDDQLLQTVSVPGPTVLVLGETTTEADELAGIMTVSYSDSRTGVSEEIIIKGKGGEKVILSTGFEKKYLKKYMI